MKKDNPTGDAKTAFEKWYWGNFIGPSPAPMSSDLIWERFRLHPVHREFPREAMEIVLSEMLDHFECDKKEIPEVRWASVISNTLHECERLFHGDQECPTCGGSGRVVIPRKSMEQEEKYWKPCPDCKEKPKKPMFTRGDPDKHVVYGDERKGQQRTVVALCYTSEYPDGKSECSMFIIDHDNDYHALDRRNKDRRKSR